MVNGLQKSMEAMIEKRAYHAQRSTDLENALTESAPEALTKSISIRTIQVADIMMELEDATEKNATFEERIHILQHGHERDKQNMQAQLDELQSDYELLEEQAEATQKALKQQLRAAKEEAAEAQMKYTKMRQNYHSLTKNIAIMATKIASVQRENRSLREEADESHRALVEMERKVRLLRESEKAMLESIVSGEAEDPDDTMGPSQSQLDESKSENEELVDEHTANALAIEELQSRVKERMASLNAQSQEQSMISSSSSIIEAQISDDTTSSVVTEVRSNMSVHTASTSPKHSHRLESSANQVSKLDGLLNIVRSISNQSFCSGTQLLATTSSESKIQIFEDISVGNETPPQPPVQIIKDVPNIARRMKICIDGMEGAYTGPLGSNGLPNGTGTIRFKNRDTYLGDLRDGKLHGKGAMYYGARDKTTVRGMFENNVLMG